MDDELEYETNVAFVTSPLIKGGASNAQARAYRVIKLFDVGFEIEWTEDDLGPTEERICVKAGTIPSTRLEPWLQMLHEELKDAKTVMTISTANIVYIVGIQERYYLTYALDVAPSPKSVVVSTTPIFNIDVEVDEDEDVEVNDPRNLTRQLIIDTVNKHNKLNQPMPEDPIWEDGAEAPPSTIIPDEGCPS